MRTPRTPTLVATALALTGAALLTDRDGAAQQRAAAQPAATPSAATSPAAPAATAAAPTAGVYRCPIPLPPEPPARPAPPVTPSSAPVQAPNLAVERYTLPNGLEVILHEDHRTPTVAVNLWYHVGGKDEPAGRNGFAHLFEHLMFQGSRHVEEDTFFLHLERAGASGINGTTSDDRTNYFETVPAGRLNLALWLESDRMAFLLDHVDQATFESQRNVVLNERRQNYENAPYGNVMRFIREAVYPPSHPYFRLPIGTPEDLEAASLEDVRQFFRTWYVPNNATLVIAGDFEPAAARQLVEQYFGPITRGADVPRRPPPLPVQLPREIRLDVEAGVQLPRVYVNWSTPAFFAPGDAELDLVANALTSGESARLHRRMVRDLQIAQDVAAYQASSQLGSIFTIQATARPGHSAEELLRVIDEELARLREAPLDTAEVTRARTMTVTNIVFSTERVASRADRFNTYNHYVGNPDYLTLDMARYQTPGAAELQTAVRNHLPADRRVVVLVHPTPGAPISGRLRATGGASTGVRQ
jgi:predicted Zn-dependent peptidase